MVPAHALGRHGFWRCFRRNGQSGWQACRRHAAAAQALGQAVCKARAGGVHAGQHRANIIRIQQTSQGHSQRARAEGTCKGHSRLQPGWCGRRPLGRTGLQAGTPSASTCNPRPAAAPPPCRGMALGGNESCKKRRLQGALVVHSQLQPPCRECGHRSACSDLPAAWGAGCPTDLVKGRSKRAWQLQAGWRIHLRFGSREHNTRTCHNWLRASTHASCLDSKKKLPVAPLTASCRGARCTRSHR